MGFVDPRERFEDLIETESQEILGPEEFEETADSEAASIGWVVLGLAFDDDDRVLLVDQPWADGWLAPGGVPKPDETLAEAVSREVKEETGVDISPVRPRGLDALTVENERTGETTGWRAVLFEADAETTAIDDDLGLEGEAIDDARWFEGFPTEVFNPEVTRPVYERCLADRSSRRKSSTE